MATEDVDKVIEFYGGLTQATVATGISTQTWMRWRKLGCIFDPHVLRQAVKDAGADEESLLPPDRRKFPPQK